MITPEDICNWNPDYFLENKSACENVMKNLDGRTSIPSLNTAPLHALRDKQFVRFRGMIQDMYNPEYYLEKFEVCNNKTKEKTMRNGKYKDISICSPDETIITDSQKNISGERQTYFVISIPCLNSWAKEKCEDSAEKLETRNSIGIKRTLNDERMDVDENSSNKKSPTVNCSRNDDNSQCRSNTLLSQEYIMNFPVSNKDGKACIVKTYDDTPFKLNQIVDIAGFISLDPLLSTMHDSDDTMDDIEFQSHNPPASLVPRLHAVDIKVCRMEESINFSDSTLNLKSARGDLELVLTQFLFGDALAAEYLICHLISSVYSRKDLLSLGTFPVNLTHFPVEKYQTFPEDFYNIIAMLVPKSYYLELALDELNNLNLLPKKDYDSNRLNSGVLQLSDNTHLILDETKLSSGEVSPNGRKNYEAISTLIQHQKISYDFKYYAMEFETDIPVLILSEARSMIPCDRQIVLNKNPESETLYPEIREATKQFLRNETRLNNIRNYLRTSRHKQLVIDDKVQEVIQNDFVKMRQSDNKMTVEDFHSLMVLARLLSLSHGMNNLTVEHWNQAHRMEIERKDRLNSCQK